jgi:hypothetical protein
MASGDDLRPPSCDLGGTRSPYKNRNPYLSVNKGFPGRLSSIRGQLTGAAIADRFHDAFGSPSTGLMLLCCGNQWCVEFGRRSLWSVISTNNT